MTTVTNAPVAAPMRTTSESTPVVPAADAPVAAPMWVDGGSPESQR